MTQIVEAEQLRNMILTFKYIFVLQNRMQLSTHGVFYGEVR